MRTIYCPPGLQTYRYNGQYGFIYVCASSIPEAIPELRRRFAGKRHAITEADIELVFPSSPPRDGR